MPEHSREPRTALAILEAEMLLDGDPTKNLATFVTTFMEPEAQEMIPANLHRNYIDHAEYPRTAEISRRCVRMLHGLFHGDGEPDEPGTACAGSSEAVMLGALAMKWRWKTAREKAGKPTDKPNLVYGADVHVVWDKFCRYFDVEPRQVDRCRKGRYTVGPDELEPQIDENTIGVVAVVGTTFTGDCDDVAGIDEMLGELAGSGLDVPMHVDAASGGFVFPFSDPDFAWDFRLRLGQVDQRLGPQVRARLPGRRLARLPRRGPAARGPRLLRGLPRRARRDLHPQLLRQLVADPRPVLQLHPPRRGRATRRWCGRWTPTRRASPTQLGGEDALELIGGEPRLPLVIAKVREDEPFTGSDLVAELAQRRGWLVPAYQLPPDNEDQQIIRMLVKINQTRELADALAARRARLDRRPAQAGGGREGEAPRPHGAWVLGGYSPAPATGGVVGSAPSSPGRSRAR